MEVNEVAARLFHRYRFLLLLAVALPMLAVAGYVTPQTASYTAHARIVATATLPRSQAEATALVNQVHALATSRDVIASSLEDQRLRGDATAVANAVTVTGLGSSALVDIAYTDPDPGMAQRVTNTLATAVTAQLDAVQIGGLPNVLKAVDKQLTELATKRAPIAAKAQDNPNDLVTQNRLAGIDRLISDLSVDRNRLAEDFAAAGHASVVDRAALPSGPDSRGMPAKLGIAAILGLALGLITVGINETIRPSVSGASRVARLLEVPTLGMIGADPHTLTDIGRRLRLAARKANVSSILLVRATRAAISPELVDRIEAATLRPEAAPGRVAISLDGAQRPGTLGTPADADQPQHLPGNGQPDSEGPLAVLTRMGLSPLPGPRRVCALDELDPSAELEQIGLVMLVGSNTRLKSIDDVRDLMTAAGWPLLGVLGDPTRGGGRR